MRLSGQLLHRRDLLKTGLAAAAGVGSAAFLGNVSSAETDSKLFRFDRTDRKERDF